MFLRLLIALALALIAAAYFFPNGDNSPTLQQGLSSIRDITKDLTQPTPQTSTVYQWQDDAGEWHFSSTPPADGSRHKIQTYRNDSNIIQAPIPTPTQPKLSASRAKDATQNTLSELTSLGRAKEIINDARAVQHINDTRIETLNKQIDTQN